MFSKSAIVLSLLVPVFAADTGAPAASLTVHEWGTFTSVAGENGAPVPWVALAAPSDLPCFVYRLSAQCVKCNVTSRVRMETPVLYFYSSGPTSASVHVELPSGVITEWYPKAGGLPLDMTHGMSGKIDWGPFRILPAAAPAFPDDGQASHYYAARNTGSAVLDVDGQREKFLFYRGVADQGVALEARWTADGKLELRNTASTPIPFAVVFENRGGHSGYRTVRDLRTRAVIDPPDRNADGTRPHRELAQALTEAGLFPQEAAAMVETWRDSWFEEGMRVFYILPRAAVDSVLPLTITPAPSSLARVFVGRVEVLSPAVVETLQTALTSGDQQTLARFGRFLEPFAARIEQRPGVVVSAAARAFLERTRAALSQQKVAPCKESAPLASDQR